MRDPAEAAIPGNLQPATEKTSRVQLALKLGLFSLGITVCVLVYLFLLSLTRGKDLSSLAAAPLAAGCLMLNFIFLRREQKSLSSLGIGSFSKMALRFGSGFSIGGIMVMGWAIAVALLTSAHWEWRGLTLNAGVANLVAFYFLNSLGEDLAYRGYAFLKLEEAFGPWPTIIGTSALFALLHVLGGVPWASAFAGVFTSGLVFGLIFSVSKSLPMAFGCHFATNIIQDIFGLRASPFSVLRPDFSTPVSERTGIIILAMVACINLAVLLIIAARHRRTRSQK